MILNFFDNIKIEQPATASHKEPSVNNQQNVTGIFVGIFATFVLASILLFSGILFYKTWKANRSELTATTPTESELGNHDGPFQGILGVKEINGDPRV